MAATSSISLLSLAGPTDRLPEHTICCSPSAVLKALQVESNLEQLSCSEMKFASNNNDKPSDNYDQVELMTDPYLPSR